MKFYPMKKPLTFLTWLCAAATWAVAAIEVSIDSRFKPIKPDPALGDWEGTPGYVAPVLPIEDAKYQANTDFATTVAPGSTNSKGIEFEGSWRTTDDLTLVFNYSYVNARITHNGKTVTDVGQMPANVPIEGASVSVTQRFSGFLRELSAHLNVQYVGNAFPFSNYSVGARRGVYFTDSVDH